MTGPAAETRVVTRVLIVEDDPADADLIRELLEEEASSTFEVVHVPQLASAVAWLERHPVDVVLLDVGLPDVIGLDGLQCIFSVVPDTPTVMLTGLNDDAVARTALQSGAQDYVVKGRVDAAHLERTVHFAIERHRFVQKCEKLTHEMRGVNEHLERTQERLSDANALLKATVQERTRRVEELAALYEIAHAVSSTLDLPALLDKLVKQVHAIVGAEACAVFLLDGRDLEMAASVGLGQPERFAHLADRRGTVGHAVQNARHISTAAVEAEGDDPFLEALGAEGLQHVMLVPMTHRSRCVGLLAVMSRTPRTGTEEEADLLLAIGKQAATGVDNCMLYRNKVRVEELLRTRLIPHHLSFPDVEVGHHYVPSVDPSNQTGNLSGDYYDLIPLRENAFGLVIADVTGKGAEAAIQALRVKHVVESYATAGASPGEILRLLNVQLHKRSERTEPVTIFYCNVDVAQQEIVYASAGHEPAILWNAETRTQVQLHTGNMLVGAFPGIRYDERLQPYRKGDYLLLYTDGVTEARSPDGDFFGLDRLVSTLESERDYGPERLANRIYYRVYHFTRGQVTDDLSVLAVRF